MADVIFAVVGVAVGGLVTWFVSRWYYTKAGAELRAESERLRKLTQLVLKPFEEAGLVKFTRSKNGEFAGLVKEAEVHISADSNLDVKAETKARNEK